jgi:hypothetical protein
MLVHEAQAFALALRKQPDRKVHGVRLSAHGSVS